MLAGTQKDNQRKTSQNIGFNHYLSKKIVAVKEYEKIVNEN